MNHTFRTLFALVVVGLGVQSNAALLIDRQPTGNSWTYSDFGPPRQFVADRFQLAGANGYADVNSITLWANWQSMPVTFGFQNMVIYFIRDVNGLPSGLVGGGGFSQFGVQAGGNFLYRYTYTFANPIRLQLGTPFWLHFSGSTGFNFGNLMSWSTTANGANSLARISTTDYLQGYNTICGDPAHAFQLEGTVTVTGPSVISGRLGLEGWASSNGTSAEIDIIQNGSVVQTLNTAVAADGSFSTTTNLTGVAQLRVRAPHFLQLRSGMGTLGYDTVNLNLPLTNGDIDGDNEIGISDYSILSANYGADNAQGDLNEDGTVDIADYSILSGNYGTVGED